MEKKHIYILNPDYDLKLDKKRVVIINRINDPTTNNFIGFVHPVYAILLSLFDGERKLNEVIKSMSSLLKKDRSFVSNIIFPLLENKKALHFNYDGYHLSFPERMLVKKSAKNSAKRFNTEDFFIPKKNLDMDSWRLYYPLDVLFMINTKCLTDCFYCYADRQKNMDCEIPLERLEELIREARKLDMRTFDITGGELFLYKYWEELLAEVLSNGFVPYISTKYPIDLEILNKLKNLGIKKIQISIDSIIKNELITMLDVTENYYHKLLLTLKELDKDDFEIHTNTQVNSQNQENIHLLLDYLLSLKNIKRMNISAAGYSIYKGEENYLVYKPDLEHVKKIESTVNDLKAKYENTIDINFSGYIEKSGLIDKTFEEKKRDFMSRSRCSANFYSFVILPDGKVTICEELYWHPQFIIGDLTKQSIEEVWNSKRALELYNISREMARDESECKTCDEFESCHRYKGVCWKEVLYAYGYENWDYPDPKCPYARKPTIKYYL